MGGNSLNTGGRYNPTTDTWATTSTINAPSGRGSHTAVWTASEMIAWGGWNGSNYLNTGGRYGPPLAGCSVSSITCGHHLVGPPPTNFTVDLSDPADPTTVQGSDFMVNGTPANNATLSNANTTITFHFNTSPVVQVQNAMLIPAGAFDCGQGPVQEFTCTFLYGRPIPTPRPHPTHSPAPPGPA
jgi:hypothetical protein